MKKVKVKIIGTTPYLMHKFSDESSTGKKTRKIDVEERTPKKEAEKVAYRTESGQLCINAFSIPKTMANAGSNHKMTGSRKSLKFIVPSAVRILSEYILMRDEDGKESKEYLIDERPVVIPATKGRIMRYRPKFPKWSLEFELMIDDDLMSIESAHQLLSEAGTKYGVGDFRPEKGGPFGMFRVAEFLEHEA